MPTATPSAAAARGRDDDERPHPCPREYESKSKRPGADGGDPVRAAGRTVRFLCAIALPFLLCGSVLAGESASLAWNPAGTAGVAGYAFYLGNKAGVYRSRFDLGTNTEITLTGLSAGHTNYFAVTAYNAAKVESPYSAEVAYIVPGLARLIPPAKKGTPVGISFPVAPGHTYSVQASTNLKTWTTIYTTPVATNNSWATCEDPQTGFFSRRFYRLILN
jgi:hypothetical protein